LNVTQSFIVLHLIEKDIKKVYKLSDERSDSLYT